MQPFVALGRELKNHYGHRIRLATHSTFKEFVEENGLEFFDIGGDPSELMAFMVKNPGLIPGMKSLRDGDVGKRQKGMAEILQGCWKSCADVDEVKEDGDSTVGLSNLSLMSFSTYRTGFPFTQALSRKVIKEMLKISKKNNSRILSILVSSNSCSLT